MIASVTMSTVFFQELLRLIYLRSEEWTPSSVWVVEQHQLPMVLPDFLFR